MSAQKRTLTRLSQPVVHKLCIIGGGLIGSSLALAAREANAASEVVLFDASADVRKRLRELAIGSVAETAAEAAHDADLVILCTPVGQLETAARAIAPGLSNEAILSDVGSVKVAALAQMRAALPNHKLIIPGHPIAGTERSGPEAGFASLFDQRWCILTPEPETEWAAVGKLTQFWQTLGSQVEQMTPKRHDLVLAVTSHVPHLIAFNIVATAADLETVTNGEVVTFSAGGFRDFTRIAASDPIMWRDVFLHNREAVLEIIGRFNEDLSILARAIRWGDGQALYDAFSRARGIRRSIIDAGQDTAAANFGRDKANQ
jgi:cyclohexadieny/prephenate dehydrogenase